MSLRSEIYDTPGYSTSLMLEPEELEALKAIVNDHYRRGLKKNLNLQVSSDVNAYHLLNLENHSEIWKKEDRFFDHKSIEIIKKFKFLEVLKDVFGDFYLSNKVNQDGELDEEEEIYWRLVRPNANSDVGNFHADIWFSEIYGYKEKLYSNFETLKVWIPVYIEPGFSGLAVCEDSHKTKHEYEIVTVGGRPRPNLVTELESKLLMTPAGTVVLFGEDLIHGGIVNTGNSCRVSIEITLVLGKRA